MELQAPYTIPPPLAPTLSPHMLHNYFIHHQSPTIPKKQTIYTMLLAPNLQLNSKWGSPVHL